MAGVIMWSFVFLPLLHSGLTAELECSESTLGNIAVYDKGREETSGYDQGTIVVCITDPNGEKYVRATLCYDDEEMVNLYAGNAACRQLGFAKVYQVKNNANSGTPPNIGAVITSIQCPVVKNLSTQGEINLLRCLEPNHTRSPDCNHYAAVECSAADLHIGDPYNGQVYTAIINTFQHLFINYSGEAMPICVGGYSDATWNSACQQMGYTGACSTCENIRPIDAGSELDTDFWYLGNVACNDGPYPCFTDCFNTSNITTVSTCEQRVTLFCIYNESNATVAGSGDKGICELPVVNEPCHSLNAAGGTLLALFLLEFFIIIFCITYIYFLARRGKEDGCRKFWPWCSGKNKESNNSHAPRDYGSTGGNGGERFPHSSSNIHLLVEPGTNEGGSLSVSHENGDDVG